MDLDQVIKVLETTEQLERQSNIVSKESGYSSRRNHEDDDENMTQKKRKNSILRKLMTSTDFESNRDEIDGTFDISLPTESVEPKIKDFEVVIDELHDNI